MTAGQQLLAVAGEQIIGIGLGAAILAGNDWHALRVSREAFVAICRQWVREGRLTEGNDGGNVVFTINEPDGGTATERFRVPNKDEWPKNSVEIRRAFGSASIRLTCR